MLQFTNMEVVGLIPSFLDENNPAPASQQIDANYQHGGGWSNFKGFELKEIGNKNLYALQYPGDPPMHELSRATFRDQTIVFFESSWLAIIEQDGSFEVSRID